VPSPQDEFCTFLLTQTDVAEHALSVFLGDEGSHIGVFYARANLDFPVRSTSRVRNRS